MPSLNYSPDFVKLRLSKDVTKQLLSGLPEGIRSRKIVKKKRRPEIPAAVANLKRCNTKKLFMAELVEMSPQWKDALKFYISNCFVFDIYNRKIECKLQLLAKSRTFFAVIDQPDKLQLGCHFDNNLIKNFCTGFANFATRNHELLLRSVDCKSQTELVETSSPNTVCVSSEHNPQADVPRDI